MEFMQVVGSRRSIRYFESTRAVEREHVLTILEAAIRASRAVNTSWSKAIVVERDQVSPETRDALKTPFASVEFDLAPTYILFYFDMDARRTAVEGKRYPTVASGAIVDMGALGPTHGWSHKYVDQVILPDVLMPGLGSGPQRGGNADAAMAMMQAYLCAVDQGLGACLVPFDEEAARAAFDVPETWEPVMALLIGYPVEEPEAGGQRPRAPWEETFFLGHTSRPFPRDPAVTARLADQGLIQDPAPLPWRHEEVRALARGYDLPGGDPVEGWI